MTDPDKIVDAITEGSKFGGALVKAGSDAGAYLADILGDLPKDLVSLFIGDRVATSRLINLARLEKRAHERIAELKVKGASIESISPNILIAIASAAADEKREELTNLWANLLATAMNPVTAVLVRQSFIDAVKRMDPPDALVLRALTKPSPPPANPHFQITDRVDDATKITGLDRLDVSTSVARLKSLEILETQGGSYQPRLTDFGHALARVILK